MTRPSDMADAFVFAWAAYKPITRSKNMTGIQYPTTYHAALFGLVRGECWALTHWKQGTHIYQRNSDRTLRIVSGKRSGDKDYSPSKDALADTNWIKVAGPLENAEAKIEKLRHSVDAQRSCELRHLTTIRELKEGKTSTLQELAVINKLHDNQKRIIRRLQTELEQVKGEKALCLVDALSTLDLQDQIKSLTRDLRGEVKSLKEDAGVHGLITRSLEQELEQAKQEHSGFSKRIKAQAEAINAYQVATGTCNASGVGTRKSRSYWEGLAQQWEIRALNAEKRHVKTACPPAIHIDYPDVSGKLLTYWQKRAEAAEAHIEDRE